MSGYVFRTVVENPAHPEYGAVSLPFPVPNEKYDHIIEELLPPMQIGDPIKQDCVVKEVDAGCWPALKVLEGQTVNVDELQRAQTRAQRSGSCWERRSSGMSELCRKRQSEGYGACDDEAKRLDSFSVGEDAQYQGMAHKLGLTDIKDLINLTFCCQRTTVIDNFRDLEKAGKAHLMNLNGGMMSIDEYEKADGQAIAEALVRSGGGQITPYGVVYDNGMELEQLYRGKEFPAYLYDASALVLAVTPKDAPADTKDITYLYLPSTQEQIDRALQRGGIDSYEEAQVKVDIDDLPDRVREALMVPNEPLSELNEMCRAIQGLSLAEKAKLDVVVECASPSSATQITRLAEHLDMFDFAPHAKTPEELDEYMVKESGHFEYDPNLEGFYDYKKLGEQRVKDHPGCFTEQGYISYEGATPLEERPESSRSRGRKWEAWHDHLRAETREKLHGRAAEAPRHSRRARRSLLPAGLYRGARHHQAGRLCQPHRQSQPVHQGRRSRPDRRPESTQPTGGSHRPYERTGSAHLCRGAGRREHQWPGRCAGSGSKAGGIRLPAQCSQ